MAVELDPGLMEELQELSIERNIKSFKVSSCTDTETDLETSLLNLQKNPQKYLQGFMTVL